MLVVKLYTRCKYGFFWPHRSEVCIHPCECNHSLKHFNVYICNLMNTFVLCSLPLWESWWIVRALAVYEIQHDECTACISVATWYIVIGANLCLPDRASGITLIIVGDYCYTHYIPESYDCMTLGIRYGGTFPNMRCCAGEGNIWNWRRPGMKQCWHAYLPIIIAQISSLPKTSHMPLLWNYGAWSELS